MTDKPNCSTCLSKTCPLSKIPQASKDLATVEFITMILKEVSCLSHPGAREYLMADAIEELEHQKLGYGNTDFDFVFNEAIALIRGVKE